LSLRARLLVAMALVAVVLVATAVVIARTTEDHLVDQIDRQLAETRGPSEGLRDYDPAIYQGFHDDWASMFGDGPGSDGSAPPEPEAEQPAEPPQGTPPERLSEFWMGFLDDGVIEEAFAPNASDDEQPVPALTVAQVEAGARDREPFTTDSTDGSVRYRVLATDLGDRTIISALPLGDVDETVRRLVVLEAIATTAVLAVLALAAWWVIRLGVRPIKRMTETATAIAAGDLSHRVPEGAARTEAGELGAALNQMLGTIEESFDRRVESEARLRQFVADASHELRTPVATIRGYAELYRVGGLGDPDELDDAMRRTEAEAIRMGGLVDDLLVLARLDAGRPMERHRVDLAALADDAARDARAVDPDRAVTSSVLDPTAVVVGDERRLRQVVANLVGNALVHTPSTASIDVRARVAGSRAVLEVADTGPGMTAEVAGRIFERFYRADPGRSRHHGGSGLGLAIVQGTVAAHGGTVAVDTAPGRGTTMRIELPVAVHDGGGTGDGAVDGGTAGGVPRSAA
jgi:two-component system, OmpR family, sensor kinase